MKHGPAKIATAVERTELPMGEGVVKAGQI